MREKTNLWRLYSAATAYGCKPSDFFTLETELAAWQLDEACLLVGRRVENNLNQGRDAFADLTPTLTPKGKSGGWFKSAKQFVKRKMKIPESGVW